MTPFETVLVKLEIGIVKAPIVSFEGKNVNPVIYQLASTKFQLSIASKGMIPHRGWRLKDTKNFYGLKGRTAEDCLKDFMENIFNVYMDKNPNDN